MEPVSRLHSCETHRYAFRFSGKRVLVAFLFAAFACGQVPSTDSTGNPWCSDVEVSKNPGGCSDLSKIPLRSPDESALPRASRLKIAKAWTRLVSEFRESHDKFTSDENSAADAVLMQIQGALLGLGFVPVGKATAKPEYIAQLVPNTFALAKYLERKHRENSRTKGFARLYEDAKSLAEQINVVAPIIPASAMKASSTGTH
jgi:hypothetical protein